MTPEEHLKRIAAVCNEIFGEAGMYNQTFGRFQGKHPISRTLLNQLWNLTVDMIPADDQKRAEVLYKPDQR